MSRGRTKPYFVLRHATSCVTAHDKYFQLPGFPLLQITSLLLYPISVIYPVFYITEYISALMFPFTPSSFLPFPPSFFSFLWIPVLFSFAHLLHLSCISSSFPLCIRPCPRPSNARVNIIRCTPFRLSSCIREKYVLQHPYDSTLQLLSSKIIQKKSDLSLEYI